MTIIIGGIDMTAEFEKNPNGPDYMRGHIKSLVIRDGKVIRDGVEIKPEEPPKEDSCPTD